MKSTTTPDLLTDSYPLDNNSGTDLLDHHQHPRTEYSPFSQLVTRVPCNNDLPSPTIPGSISFLASSNSQQTWNEVNGDWRHQRNSLASSEGSNRRGEPLWFDSDQIDVPLLTSNVIIFSHTFHIKLY